MHGLLRGRGSDDFCEVEELGHDGVFWLWLCTTHGDSLVVLGAKYLKVLWLVG